MAIYCPTEIRRPSNGCGATDFCALIHLFRFLCIQIYCNILNDISILLHEIKGKLKIVLVIKLHYPYDIECLSKCSQYANSGTSAVSL